MRIVGVGVCGPHEAGRYMRRTLESFKLLCDDVIIATCNAGPKEKKLIKEFGFQHYEDNREWGLHQPRIKTELLRRAGELKPDWIAFLDMDEVFGPEFTRKEAEKLASTDEVSWHFMIVNLYNDEQHFAHDAGIQRFWNVRYFKYDRTIGLDFLKRPLHCGSAPNNIYKLAWHAPFYVLHYGLMKEEDRLSKIERYQKYDPRAEYMSKVYYDDLGKELQMRPFDPESLIKQLQESRDCQPRKFKISPTQSPDEDNSKEDVQVRRLKDGVTMSVPRYTLEATIKQGFELV